MPSATMNCKTVSKPSSVGGRFRGRSHRRVIGMQLRRHVMMSIVQQSMRTHVLKDPRAHEYYETKQINNMYNSDVPLRTHEYHETAECNTQRSSALLELAGCAL